jgi:hypothetical protein
MEYDVKSCPAHILTIQEARVELLERLRAPGAPGILREEGASTHGDGGGGGTHGDGGGGKWLQRPTAQFFCIRAEESCGTVMICARKSLVQGVRLLFFCRRYDGDCTTDRLTDFPTD